MSKQIWGILAIYDRDRTLQPRTQYLAEQLSDFCTRLYIVINGGMQESALNSLKELCEQVVIRPNIGFDAAAYEEVYECLPQDELQGIDELIFCNDTFYGFMKPLSEIDHEMDRRNPDADFWGLTFHQADYLSHVQSYFLCFRQSIIRSGVLQDFFNRYKEYFTLGSFLYAVSAFEFGLSHFLFGRGYRGAAFSDIHNLNIFYCPEPCIERYGLPVIKRKFFTPKYFDTGQWKRLQNYLLEAEQFRVLELIRKEIPILPVPSQDQRIAADRLFYAPVAAEDAVLSFISRYRTVYIYGAGVIATKFYVAFQEHLNNKFGGFMVTSLENNPEDLFGFPVLEYRHLDDDEGVLICVKPDSGEAIYNRLFRDKDNALKIY